MNSRLRKRPPKHRLAARSGNAMWPIGLAFLSNTRTPSRSAAPMPHPHHKLPSISTRKPSGVPASASIKMRFLASFFPPSTTSNARINRFGAAREATTYRIDSSGENASPFGPSTSSATIVGCPVWPSMRQTAARISDSAFSPSYQPLMPNDGSVNQIEPSDFTTTSLGEFSRLPSWLSIRTVMLPSYSVRVTRRPRCSHVTRRPCRSRVLPLAFQEVFRNTLTAPVSSSHFRMRSLGMSLQSTYRPSPK
jgi:hypothetical protein